ncbi:MAG TPA: 50S ribosomal protein L6 [Crenotrichaceae bacterium]|nr:50S ribosomal protein L6 [Crenotrichaceae bacterium]
MSRIANNPITLPAGVNIDIKQQAVHVKGPKGELNYRLQSDINLNLQDNVLTVKSSDASNDAMAGTTRAIVNNMCIGVSTGFQKKLQLVGVGYRAQAKGNDLTLTLGFSHPVVFKIPTGISIETPSQTEIVVNGVDKQLVGEVASKIRQYRPPEPYKGKGVRYSDEHVVRKEAKKK